MHGPADYRPVACDRYSEYELAILRRQWLKLVWASDPAVVHTQRLLPLDLKTENKQEFLLCRTDTGEPIRIRLDYIRKAEPG